MGSNVPPASEPDKTSVPVSGRVKPGERRLIWIAAAMRGIKPAEFIAKAAVDAALGVVAEEKGKPLTA